jgi:hypothetical protein
METRKNRRKIIRKLEFEFDPVNLTLAPTDKTLAVFHKLADDRYERKVHELEDEAA